MTPKEIEAQLQAKIDAAHAEGAKSTKGEIYDRTTLVAFGLLFVLPTLIIAFAMLFLLPVMVRSIQQEPSGATTLRSNSGDVSMK